jgi:thymidine kinase
MLKRDSKQGYLELFIGPMFSGKTSKLIELYKQNAFCGIPIAVINHSLDTRYHGTMLSTHDKDMVPCIQTSLLKDIWSNDNVYEAFSVKYNNHMALRSAEVILINEGQFFDDLYECVRDMLLKKKRVYIAGLDGDFERKKIGQIIDLIPLCDKVTKLTSICSSCRDGTPGIFSLRLTDETEQTVVGIDNYIPLCRKCYEIKNRYI